MEAWVCRPSMLLPAAKYKHFGLSVNAICLTQVGCTHPLPYRIALILLAQNNFEMLIMQVRVYRFTLILHRFYNNTRSSIHFFGIGHSRIPIMKTHRQLNAIYRYHHICIARAAFSLGRVPEFHYRLVGQVGRKAEHVNVI